MKTLTTKKHIESFSIAHQKEIAGGGFLAVILIILFVYHRIKNTKLKQFLYANNYTEANFKTQKVIYPKLWISKTKIIIKNSNKITSKQVLDDREKWKKFFKIQILSVEDENHKTIIYLG